MTGRGVGRKLFVGMTAMMVLVAVLGLSGLRAVFILREMITTLEEIDAQVLVEAGDALSRRTNAGRDSARCGRRRDLERVSGGDQDTSHG